MIVITDSHKHQVSFVNDKENAQIEPSSSLEESPDRPNADGRVLVWTAKGDFQPSDGIVNASLLVGSEFSVRALEGTALENHFFQGLSLPALRSRLIARVVRA